jgi:hypothetical protein
MKWVKNPYNKDFVLKWNNADNELCAGDFSPLPDEVIDAFFPNPDKIKVFLPGEESPRRQSALRSLLEVYLCRWDGQWQEFLTIEGDVYTQNRQILDFFKKFHILDKKPKKQ